MSLEDVTIVGSLPFPGQVEEWALPHVFSGCFRSARGKAGEL